ncbi:MAG: NADAR family protein [Olsenella sp.]|nr:NADAR family protein [Olsenella sp.]
MCRRCVEPCTLKRAVRKIVVYEGLLAKFSQNGDLLNRLLATGDDVLAECAVKDRIWGIGLSMDDPRRFNKSLWKGQNLLGSALMMARDSLSWSTKRHGT